MENKSIVVTIAATVNAPVEKVWNYWTTPAHILNWNTASDDWHTTKSENDVRPGGTFSSRMEAKDGSFGFDFHGVHDEVRPNEYLASTMGDSRKMTVTFAADGEVTHIIETFEAENENPVEVQRTGWQAILDNFKKYTEQR